MNKLSESDLPERTFEQASIETSERQELVFRSIADEIPAVRNFITDCAQGCGFADDEIWKIRVASSEACTNAVEHGSPRGADNWVNVSCFVNAGDFVVEIRDEGEFGRKQADIDDLSLRGRGILLMLSLMDKVTFDETPQGTRVILRKHLPGGERLL